MYKFIRGQVCDSDNLTEERIWRGVARRIAQWHALLPVAAASSMSGTGENDSPPTPLKELSSVSKSSIEDINRITPGKLKPNVWTVIQKWILALPTTSEVEKQRKDTLQQELERTVADLANVPSFGKDGVSYYESIFSRGQDANRFSWCFLIVTY